MIQQFKFIHFLTATCLIEVFMLYLFRFTNSPLAMPNSYYILTVHAVNMPISNIIMRFAAN